MYLKKIDALGFKSFANRTVLEFTPGIMGIVGPNGSGKSNVADAVRWVLGEQSARQLRGSNMQDVIFAGTENRRPQSYAAVTLVIDNSDHMLAIETDEVTISRKVFRSGESEYSLNGHICRLRDVQELFYDTGIGKEGYSIIGQGQIDRILSGKPEERREIIDEAAGIVKFKKRKAMTLKKLETEEGNLARVTDILQELTKRVGPLEKQAVKAKEYLRLRDSLKAAEVQAFRLESEDIRRRLEENEVSLRIINSDLGTARRDSERQKNLYDEMTERRRAIEESDGKRKKELSDTQVRKENLGGQIRVLEEQIRTAVQNETGVRERLDVLAGNIAELEKDRKTCRRKLADSKKECGEAEEKAGKLEQDLASRQEDLKQLAADADEENRRRLSVMERMTECRTELERAGVMLEQAKDRLGEMNAKSEEDRQEREKAKADAEKIRRTLTRIEEEIRANREALAAENARLRRDEKKSRELSEQADQNRQKYLSVRSRRDTLLSITERYEGYGNSVRKVMEKKTAAPGIVGVVADLFRTDRKYELALETALGGRLQNIVTKDEETAKNLIQYLKKNKFGRATFLPLTSVSGRERFPRPEAQKEPGAIGVASALVQTEDAYRGIAAHLLGRILVVDTIDHALAIARKYRYSLSLVTLEGESLSPGGAMTGGSYRSGGNLLGRRREIRELEEKAAKMKARMEDGAKEIGRLQTDVEETKKRQEMLAEEIHDQELQKARLTVTVQQKAQLAESMEQGHLSREEEKEVLTRKMTEWENGRAEASDRLSELEEELAAAVSRIGELERRTEESRNERDRVSGEVLSLRQDISRLTEQNRGAGENLERLDQELAQNRAEEKILQDTLMGESPVAAYEKELSEARAKVSDAEKEICRLEEEVSAGAAEKERLDKGCKKIFDEREATNERLQNLDRESFRMQSSREKMEETRQKLVDHLWNEYGMTVSEAERAETSEKCSLAESRRRISQTKTAIRELGPVNVNAMEEYKEVSERYTFIRAQHEDLVEAAERLKKIIRELETGMRKQFREKFAQIQTEFDRVFRELFGGGRGSLELAEAEDLLDAGILINAQPPGKKLQNMMQLSGGEKALSAIALLFAIQNLKPSPFCLLDEIEAALDEPNVDRYAQYLNRLKNHTQFIVITHRRGTMESADRLYGITMQEKGISTLVSVDLTDPTLTA